MLFQKNVIKKYIATLNDDVEAAWNQYKSYFLVSEIQANIRQSKEEQFQEGFLRELFVKVLGYTLNPSPDFNLITEQKNETNSQKADGAILLDGNVIGVIELKDHKTTDLSKIEKQAFSYKSQHRDARYVIISNFEKLRFYIDNAVDFREWSLFSSGSMRCRDTSRGIRRTSSKRGSIRGNRQHCQYKGAVFRSWRLSHNARRDAGFYSQTPAFLSCLSRWFCGL